MTLESDRDPHPSYRGDEEELNEKMVKGREATVLTIDGGPSNAKVSSRSEKDGSRSRILSREQGILSGCCEQKQQSENGPATLRAQRILSNTNVPGASCHGHGVLSPLQ